MTNRQITIRANKTARGLYNKYYNEADSWALYRLQEDIKHGSDLTCTTREALADMLKHPYKAMDIDKYYDLTPYEIIWCTTKVAYKTIDFELIKAGKKQAEKKLKNIK